ncbi:TonB-dependent receptor [Phenylobacterium sp. LH3H17]|uniref:TonB-dependent receptor n=1 Tax=Phenylobacterium sp. LH3H17 TaxID=2903901 RepID=UPI0020C9A725|nr:TonB-dependent receptor [Phenylobacterium sp. LH3H17]UTP38201.1 TonB-dependent receptor [Phenylobacterium sp. LH3H17]
MALREFGRDAVLRRLWFSSAAFAVIAFAATGVQAAEESTSGSTVEELIVTALKREARLQDVAATITAIGADTIRQSRVAQVLDLASYNSNVDIKETVPGALPTVTIRGIGLDDFSTTSSASAGIYVDEVPLSSPALMSGNFLDLARIETLKGPQGTLYGRNSTAGAVNIISARPEKTFGGFAKLAYGNYQTLDAEAALNVPISDRAQLRLSARAIQQDKGFWTSSLLADGRPGERDIGSRDIWLGRVQLALQPTENLDVNLKLEGLRSRSELGISQHNGAFTPGQPFVPCAPVLAGRVDSSLCADGYGYQNPYADPYRGDWKGQFPYNIDQFEARSTIRYQWGEYELTSITSYINFARIYYLDVDGTPREQFNYIENEAVRQATQELRVGRSTELVDVIAGGFLSWDHVLGDNSNLNDEWSLLLLGANNGSGSTTYNQTTRTAAAYTNLTWHLKPDLDLVTGLRYTDESRHYAGGTFILNPTPAFGLNSTFLADRIVDRNLTWTLGLNYRVTEDALVYGLISRGVKSGGFFSGYTTSNAQLIPYKPEQLTAFEVGAKTQWSNVLTLNASVFYYDYKDPQTFIRFVDPANGIPIQKVGNVDSARNYGADIDASWRVTDGLTLTAGLGLLHTRLSEFSTAAGLVPAGNRLGNSPTVTFNGAARYEWEVMEGLRASLRAEARYSGSTFKEATNNPLIASDEYWLFNARFAIAPEASNWEVALWGRNLADKLHAANGIDGTSLGFINKTYNAPRTYGVEVFRRF